MDNDPTKRIISLTTEGTGGPERRLSPEIEQALTTIYELDPELFEYEDTRRLIELGVAYGEHVTEKYGTPDEPKWASGTQETNVFMSYHNGGETGHTSVGEGGAGVPRSVLLVAKAVNEAVGGEVYDAHQRALALYVAYAHDSHQLCGRSLLEEGQGEDRGDERISAEAARGTLLAAGFDEKTADQAYVYLMATAFNPLTSSQNVNYDAWHQNPSDSAALQSVLGQELLGAGDLLRPSAPQGPLGAVEYSIEMMCLAQYEQKMQIRLAELGINTADITNIEEMLAIIDSDAILRSEFVAKIDGQAAFFRDHLRYSDKAIRTVCGKGIDELFPGREENARTMERYSQELATGASARRIWEDARRKAEGMSS